MISSKNMQVDFLKLKKKSEYFDLCICVRDRQILCHRILVCQSSELIDMLVRNGKTKDRFVSEIRLDTTDLSYTDIEDAINTLYSLSNRNDVTINIGVLNYLLVKPTIIRELLVHKLPYDRRLDESEARLILDLYNLYGCDQEFLPLYQFYYDELRADDEFVEAMKGVELRFGCDLPSKDGLNNVCIHFPSEKYGYLKPFGKGVNIYAFGAKWKMYMHKDEDGTRIIRLYTDDKADLHIRGTLIAYQDNSVSHMMKTNTYAKRKGLTFILDIYDHIPFLRYTFLFEQLK